MSILSMVEAKLPPGFRFHPRDDELICDYLAMKVAGDGGGSFRSCPVIVAVDLNKCEPCDLPDTACVGGKEWYIFSVRDRKYATGQRTNRATVSGYWKATGKDRSVKRNGLLVGMRKTLVFYKGRAPSGKKTDWVMHEYRIEDSDAAPRLPFKEDWVLCRVFFKSNGISTNSGMEKNHEDDSGPQSLPALVDNHFTINQTPLNLEGFELVPCLSSITPGPTPRAPDLAPHLPSAENDSSLARCFPQSVDFPHSRSGLSQFSGDIKFMKSVPVNHLTKLEAEPNLAQVCFGGLRYTQWRSINLESFLRFDEVRGQIEQKPPSVCFHSSNAMATDMLWLY